MANPDIRKIIEAVLFAADSPIPLDKLTDIVEGADRGAVRGALKELAEQFDSEERPYALSEVAGGWQVYCRPEYSKWIRELHKGRIPTRLSQAALETLAIVAYKQPIVRAEIETIRGVDSSGVLATLMRRDLITIAGRAPGMGRALMYRTTREFLRYFGLNYVTDLPRLEEFAEVLGLKPGEMELAVEGAESVAEVHGAEGPDDGEEEYGEDYSDGEDYPDGEGYTEGGSYADEDGYVEELVTEQGEAVPVHREAERREGGTVSGDREVPVPKKTPGHPAHGETHAIDDRLLIDDSDEA